VYFYFYKYSELVTEELTTVIIEIYKP